MKKKIVLIDMDGVLVDFGKAIETEFANNPEYLLKYQNEPDLIPNIFENPEPVEGAIDAVRKLAECGKYDLFIATTSPWDNPDALTHKRLWIEKYFGDLFKKKMFITHRKDLLIGDYLIDDRLKNGAEDFREELLHFGWDYENNKWNKYRTWEEVINKLL